MWATTISFFSTALFFLPFVALAEDEGCPSIGQPRKHVVCYYDGKRPVSSLNICLCTHLIYTSIGINEYGQLQLSENVKSDITAIRKQNPRLRVVASLGGEAMKGSLFSSLITENESFSNLTSSINDFHKKDVIDGLEIDWEWPVRDGGKKDRMKLIRYARQIKIAVGEEFIRSQRNKRETPIDSDEEEGGEDIEDEIIEANEDEEQRQQEEEDETSKETVSSTTSEKIEISSDISFPSLSSQFPSSEAKEALLKGEQQRKLQRKLNLRRRLLSERYRSSDNSLINSTSTSIASRSRFPNSSLSSLSSSYTSRSNSRYRVNRTKFTPKTKTKLNNSHRSQIKRTRHRTATKKVQRTRLRGKARNLSSTRSRKEKEEKPKLMLEDLAALEDLQSLVENLLEKEEADNEGDFLIFLRLSPIPKYLVKGYDFKMLNKFVDYYTLPSNNFTLEANNVTFHHSRLMGASDIENADSMIDMITSLGADEQKVILTGTALSNKFNLLDGKKNTPGSASTGVPSVITYQQVCQSLKKNNWTVERDEDMTGPYAYDDKNHWLAFDDATSLKIKTKYALLRNLGGVGLYSIDADDVDNHCGNGAFSLIRSIHATLSHLDRRPRQLIVHSLEQDLIATAQNIVPVIAPGISVSPYRIVRIVDREGHITSIRENAETTLECTRQGYYRNPEDCSQFYRCVKFNQYENDYTIFEYACPNGLVFDDRWEVCVWPSQASPCDGSSEIRPVPRNEYVCPGEGYFVDPENCRWFFACLDHEGDGSLRHYEFRCPFGLAFDEVNLICNWPWLVPACGGTGGRVGKILGGGRGNGFSRPPVRQGKAFGGSGGRGRPALGNSLNGIGSGSGLPIDSRPFQSPNPGRQPIRPRPNRPRPGPSRRPALNSSPTTPPFETSFPSSTFAPSTPRPRPTASPSRRPFPSTFAPRPTPGPTAGPSRRPFQNTFAPATAGPTAGPSRRPFQSTFAPATASPTAGPSRRPFQSTFAPATAGPSRRPFQNTFAPTSFSQRPIPTSSPASNGFDSGVPFQSTFAPSTVSPSRRPGFGRQPNRFGDRTPTQIPRRPKQFGGFEFGDVVPGSEGCQGCESPTLFITGKGVSNGKGIEVAHSGREGKSNNGFPSTTASPVTPGYQPFFSTTPDYGSGEGIAVDNAPNGGYNYPVPSNPLHLPGYGIDVSNDGEYGIRPGSGISSTSPVPTSTTTTAAPVPSTYAPTTPAPPPAYGAPSSTAGYEYPVPANPLQYPTSPSTPRAPPTYKSPVTTPYQPPYAPTSPAYQPAYSPTTPAYQYPSTTKAPVYPSSTPKPAYSPAPSYPSTTAAPPAYQSPTAGYNYPVPQNPLKFPEGNRNQGGFRAPAIDNSGFSPINNGNDDYYDYDSGEHDQGNRGFTQPDIDYSGFDAPSIAELPRRPKTHHRPSHGKGLTPGKVQFGFTPIPGQNPRRPKQQFPQRPRQPLQSPDFAEPPSRFPNNNSPSFFNSVVDTVTTTFASFVPAFTTARPAPTRRPVQPVPPRPSPTPTRRPPTQRPRPRPTPTARRPQSSGGRRPFNNQEVANVIPSGFSSATLSNGPNSIPQGNSRFPEANRNVFGRPSGNGINSVFGSGRPSGGGSFSANNSPSRPFTAFNRPQAPRPSRPAGSSLQPSNFGRPAATRPQTNNAPRPSGIRPPPPRPSNTFSSTTFGGNGQGNRFPNNGPSGAFTAFNRPQGSGAGNRPSSNSNGFGSLNNNRPLPSTGGNVRPSNAFNGIATQGGSRGPPNRPGFGGSSNANNNRPLGGFNGGNSIDGTSQEGREGRQFGGLGGNLGGRGNGNFGNPRRPQNNRPAVNNRRPQGSRGLGGNRAVSGNNAGRGGRQFSRFEGKVPAHIRPANGVKVTSVTAPVKSRPAVINKFTGSEWNKFGPGGFRSFNDTMGPEVCKRPGLFRHPTECDKFYECYWDKWIEKYTLHVFPCPVVLGYDTDITACNWPFEGPHAQCAKS